MQDFEDIKNRCLSISSHMLVASFKSVSAPREASQPTLHFFLVKDVGSVRRLVDAPRRFRGQLATHTSATSHSFETTRSLYRRMQGATFHINQAGMLEGVVMNLPYNPAMSVLVGLRSLTDV